MKNKKIDMEKIVLDGDLLLKNLEGVKQQLLSASKNPNDFEIEFRNMEKYDVAGIQLLYAFKRHCLLHTKTVLFSFLSAEQEKKCKEMIKILN